ncbi:hypothetical protein M434DRAFT_66778 [Hypoxylon sp. CO27-5]|nr:hypothetical protein M434DRAFT_66778 [Hypoxylon sp. CO27-5]
MASFRGRDGRSSPAPPIQSQHDPFVAGASTPGSSHHRFSNFDPQLFALGPHASPAQAKRALEAHLAETDRRMEEAGKLGTALVQQRKELTERLREVEKFETEGELSDDLRQRLAEIERDYNDVARESARAFLPKQRVPSSEAASGSPFVPEGKGGRRSVSPSKFEAQATGSPTKFSVPNRKVRNQPANRIHDIEFAAEISTSLIAQVRNLQGLLAEKEEELKEVKNAKSKLEYEAEGFQQRVKTLDESEHRYKDENWSLETQVHDLLAKEREAQDREKKLNQALNLLQAEKTSIQRELDEVKLSHSKLSEEHATAMKHHDIELGTAKRNMVIADTERAALRRKIDDLTGQNQELAKAVSASQRARIIERSSILGVNEEDLETLQDKSTPEHSPPPSPVKGTPRHSMLESETLKTSLGHAQRTIQGLRNNVHREKTEKLELKRMLQEARDELEKLRHEPVAQNKQNKRTRKAEAKEPKKPLRLLGNLRTVRSEVFSEDSNWEDQPDSTSPTRSSLASQGSSKFESVAEEPVEQFETANETSDAAFETAHEPTTETDDFHTGAEEFSSDDDDDDAETETESPSKRLTPRNRPSSFSMGLARSGSLHSTASTEDDDYPFDEMRTPTILPPLQQKFPLRVSRGAYRRSRQPSEEPMFPSSPPSIASSTGGTPLRQPSQSLAAELGDFDASDAESAFSATPSRRSIRGRTWSPPPPVPPLPRVIMVDNSTMTDDVSASSLTSTPEKDFDLLPALEFSTVHSQDVEPVSVPDTHAAELAALQTEHEKTLKEISDEKAAAYTAALEELKRQHAEQLNQVQIEAGLAHTQEFERNIEALKSEHAAARSKELDEIAAKHLKELEALRQEYESSQTKALEELTATHSQQLEDLKKERLLADHAAELEALRKSLEVTPQTLGFSSVKSTETVPVEAPQPRTPRREAFIIPREDRAPQTPLSAIGLPGRKGERAPTPQIAEDETRQSPSATPGPETPESQRPFKEMSTNTDVRPSQKATTRTSDQSAQTNLTSDGLDRLLKHQSRISQDTVTITTPRGEVTVTPFDEARTKQRAGEGSAISAPEPIPARRPGSSASARGSALNRPPLPANHKEAIEAARTNSSQGGKGTMGPPLLPASAYPKTPVSRPETPSNQRPMSPSSVKGTPTPKAGRSSTPGHVDIHSPARLPGHLRSRQSSVSSFASEIDTRFNIRGNMSMDAAAFGPNTDPRMIQAITQTMIGEYLWKYTRKTGRGEMSENRHRRYFWVHPYTRTLYWSERDPSTAGRSELKTKSIPIEAVRIVGDDNPMPPGLHRKSLIIVSPGRTVKFTCTTGQRHETWFNALSYLLLRTGNEHQTDAEDMAGQITQEDVDEFNPQMNRRTINGNRSQVPPSLSSYNSRTTRNDSPNIEISMHIPTLTPTREREPVRSGTLGRLSGYWRSSTINSTFSSLRSRSHIPQDSAIYEASEVPDSAEDLRQIIEQQDRDADRMENVRACCDGMSSLHLS